MLEIIKKYLLELNITSSIQDISLEQLLFVSVGAVLVLLPLLFKKTLANFISSRIEVLLKKFKVDQASINKVSESIKKPLNLFGYFLSLTFLVKYFSLDAENYKFINNVYNSLGVIIVFFVIHASTGLLSRKLKQLQKVFSKEMIEWLLKAIRVLIIFLAIASVLELWGIRVAPILAGLGLFGVAVALGAQDLFKNLIAGILVLAEKRFEQGDWIKVDGVLEGTVDRIGFRSTKIIRFDKAPVYVPNTKLSDNVVTNFSRMSHRQIKFNIGVLYSTTTEQLKEIVTNIENYIKKNSDFASEGVTTFVRVVGFNDSSIDLQIYSFTNTTVWTEYLVIKQDLITEIKQIVEKSGTEFAFPSTSLYIEADNTKSK